MTEVQIAERLARFAHADQTEESTGDPYVFHLERVVRLVEEYYGGWPAPVPLHLDTLRAVAWLHDLIEDTDYTGHDLLVMAFSPAVCAAVTVLTRTPDLSYPQYIDQILHANDPYALVVKYADLIDHLRPNCPVGLRPRYEAAITRVRARLAVDALMQEAQTLGLDDE
jgi:(p)ppGpp synthase/HD superfamily hydrolase